MAVRRWIADPARAVGAEVAAQRVRAGARRTSAMGTTYLDAGATVWPMRWPDHLADEDAGLRLEARESARLTAEQRVELFCSIMQMIQETWACLPHDERLRRLKIGEELEPGPRPWWTALPSDARP